MIKWRILLENGKSINFHLDKIVIPYNDSYYCYF